MDRETNLVWENLQRAGIRSIDLDYLLDPRVDQAACQAALKQLVDVQLARWLEVRSTLSEEQWAFFDASGEKTKQTRALKDAAKALKIWFKQTVLVHYELVLEKTSKSKSKKHLDQAGVELK